MSWNFWNPHPSALSIQELFTRRAIQTGWLRPWGEPFPPPNPIWKLPDYQAWLCLHEDQTDFTTA